MNKPRDPSTDTSTATTDTTTQPEQIVQPTQPAPVIDSFGSVPTGDDSVSGPVIINR